MRYVLGVLCQPPLVTGAGLGADERIGTAPALGLVQQVEPVIVNDSVQVAAQLLAERKPQYALPWVGVESLQRAAMRASTRNRSIQ